MKLRTDFVSNSSSSSFVLFGASYTIQELKDAVKDKLELGEDYGVWEITQAAFRQSKDIGIVTDYDNETVYVGMSPRDMKDTETLGEFKTRIQGEISKACPDLPYRDIEYVQGIDSDEDICFE